MENVISKDGTKIAYTRTGNGPVIILVGGALQYKGDQLMAGLIPLLANGFTVISYDRRGRIDSNDTAPYTIEREIEDLEAIIKATGDSTYVFGNSSGGALALLAAAKLPAIKKIATYEAPFIPEKSTDTNAEYISQLKKYNAANQPGDAVKLFLKRIGMPGFMIAIIRFTPMWPNMKALGPSLLYDAILMGDGTVPPQLKKLSIPVMAITGTADQMQQAAQSIITVVPHAKHRVLEGQTHNVKAAVLAAALTEFFKEK